MNGRICGTGSYVPGKVLTNDDLAQMVETNDAWIQERTGIARRHIISGRNPQPPCRRRLQRKPWR